MIVAVVYSSAQAQEQPAGTKQTVNKLVVQVDKGKERISKNIYGQFSEHLGGCIYGGIWVGPDSSIPNTRGIRSDVVQAFKRIKVPVLRWPGGCFADEYHWKDGIGPRDQRPSMVNTHWGMVVENNHFGTHEFLDLCEQLGCEPYVCGNVGSGTIQEMQQWVEYITFDGSSPMAQLRRANGMDKPWKLRYFGIGNENWGCGGNMTAEFYADQYKNYQTYIRNFSGNRIFKIACGANGGNYNWTEVLMQKAARQMSGLSMHYYCGSGRRSRSATIFEEEDWFEQLKRALVMNEIVTRHSEMMDKYDPQKRVALIVDEWGAWHDVEPGTNRGFLYQQNSLRDALVAGVSLNILNSHCDRVKMANIAQMVNVLQAMILTKDERMILTPTYHVFEMYTVHQDATLMPVELSCRDYSFGTSAIPALNVSASKDQAGKIHISLCNLDAKAPVELACELRGAQTTKASGRILTAEVITAHNTFENPEVIRPTDFGDFRIAGGLLTVKLPAKSVVVLEVE
jgi:alpha-N-arabinofuranosidase